MNRWNIYEKLKNKEIKLVPLFGIIKLFEKSKEELRTDNIAKELQKYVEVLINTPKEEIIEGIAEYLLVKE